MNTVFENKSIMDYVFESDTMMKKISYEDFKNHKHIPNNTDHNIEDVYTYYQEVKPEK